MIIKSRTSQHVTRLIIEIRTWILHRQIEQLYRQQQRLKQHHRIEREMLANQHQLELANLEQRTRQLECAKIQLYPMNGVKS